MAGPCYDSPMRLTLPLAALALFATLALPAVARAAAVAAVADSGMLLLFEGPTVVAREEFRWTTEGDSVRVFAAHTRSFLDEAKVRQRFEKRMELVVDGRDFGLRSYTSNQTFLDRTVVRGIVPEDTLFTYYSEVDGACSAIRLVRPPGRLYVLDSGMFTLFDVLCRSVAGREFRTRRVQTLALAPDTVTTPLVTLTQQSPDTVRVDGGRLVLRRYVFEDGTARFDLWADPEGRLRRLSHEASGLRVERAADAATAPPPTRKRTGTTKPKR